MWSGSGWLTRGSVSREKEVHRTGAGDRRDLGELQIGGVNRIDGALHLRRSQAEILLERDGDRYEPHAYEQLTVAYHHVGDGEARLVQPPSSAGTPRSPGTEGCGATPTVSRP
ncbi:hypothetical protein ACFVZC_17415 [Streptomyces marokkonensis]|uniref:Uncharacterized protein n=1 Tax=Streptomyces marokkonensis TaxID=324855 RepID=A0ABW6Q7I7_9ACTN